MGGIVGPAGFIAAWVAAGAMRDGYSPVNDAISRLAAVGAPDRALMTAGFVCFGVAVPVFGLALRGTLPGPAWGAAVATGVATLGVAALPLDVSQVVDVAHGAAATTGYITLAAIPLFAAKPLAAMGFPRAARASVACGVLAGACLALTVGTERHGFFQRAGLSIGDAWLVGAAVWMLRRSRRAA